MVINRLNDLEKTKTKGGGRCKMSFVDIQRHLNLEEIETSHILSGVGEGHVQGRG